MLIVEDAHLIRRIASRILSEAGVRVLEAADADEAREVLRLPQAKVDLVLLDVVLPGEDSVSLYRDITTTWPNLPVLFMSAYLAEILAAHGQSDLSAPFIGKPYTRDELVTKVSNVIERRRSGFQDSKRHEASS